MPKGLGVDAIRGQVVAELVVMLEQGISWSQAKDAITLNYGISESMFTTCWRIATSQHAQMLAKARQRVEDSIIDAAVNRAKKAILTKEEAMVILTKIAKGKAEYKQERKDHTVLVRPTFLERTNAVKLLAEMEGWNSPTVIENTQVVEFRDAE